LSGGGGGAFSVTTVWDGYTSADGSSPQHVVNNQQAFGITGTTAASSTATITVTISYTGSPLPENHTHYVRIRSLTSSQATGGTWDLDAGVSIVSTYEYTSIGGGERLDLEGETLKRIELDENGEMEFLLAASANATATGSVAHTAVMAGFDITVVDKGINARVNSPAVTFRRAPGGGQIQNGYDEHTGIWRTDIGLLPQYVYYGQSVRLTTTWIQGATVVGFGWNSLSGIYWAGHNEYLDSTVDLNAGSISSDGLFESDITSQSLLHELIADYYAPPIDLSNIAYATDVSGSMGRAIELYIHGPLEPTDDTWHAPYSGRLDDCDVSAVSLEYPSVWLGEAMTSSENGDGQHVASFFIENYAEKEFGTITPRSVDLTLPFKKALELHYGASFERDSRTTFGYHTTFTAVCTVPAGWTARLIGYWSASEVFFPYQAHFDGFGYLHDDRTHEVRGDVVFGYEIELTQGGN
jgi:hypothetical protein